MITKSIHPNIPPHPFSITTEELLHPIGTTVFVFFVGSTYVLPMSPNPLAQINKSPLFRSL